MVDEAMTASESMTAQASRLNQLVEFFGGGGDGNASHRPPVPRLTTLATA